jgi:hypothetical protein
MAPTFNFEATNIHHYSCSSSYKLLDDPSKIVGLCTVIHVKQSMVVELCVENYATYDGLINGVDSLFKTSTSYHNKTIVWILFPKKKNMDLSYIIFSCIQTKKLLYLLTPLQH